MKYDSDTNVFVDRFKEYPYFIQSSEPNYMFIYISLSPGWGIGRPQDYAILYNFSTHKVEYSRIIFMPEYDDATGGLVDKIESEYIGEKRIWKKVSAEKMLNFEYEQNVFYNDVSIYYLTLKVGSQIRQYGIESPLVNKYKPFLWLIKIIDDLNDSSLLDKIESFLKRHFDTSRI